jgi:hypothetical protein
MTLSELTDGRYKIILDESWHHERPEAREPDRSWYEMIACKGGAFIRIYCDAKLPCPLWSAGCPLRLPDCRQHGDVILKLWTPRPINAKEVWNKIKDHPSCYLDTMTGETDIYFPAKLVHLVAELAEARRKRRLSEKAKKRLLHVGRATQFRP